MTEMASGLYGRAYLTTTYLFSQNSNYAINAITQYSPWVRSPDGSLQWSGNATAGVVVAVNYAPNVPFNNGTVTDNAITLLHELGHVYGYLFGASSTLIANDGGSPATSVANTQLVQEHCFP